MCCRCFRPVVFRRPGLKMVGIKRVMGGGGEPRERGGDRRLEELTGWMG